MDTHVSQTIRALRGDQLPPDVIESLSVALSDAKRRRAYRIGEEHPPDPTAVGNLRHSGPNGANARSLYRAYGAQVGLGIADAKRIMDRVAFRCYDCDRFLDGRASYDHPSIPGAEVCGDCRVYAR